ncbi:MAG: hypothetical protein HUU08_03920 [Candidatus Brocadia sp.]|nr:hypothetical protein [Candidatus Brocadia sp.]
MVVIGLIAGAINGTGSEGVGRRCTEEDGWMRSGSCRYLLRPTINEPEILTLNDFFNDGVKFVTIATVRDNSYNTKKFSDSNNMRLCAK